MKKITTGAFSAALMAGCLSSGVHADQLSNLFEESQLDLKLRNAYFNSDGKNTPEDKTKRRIRQWGQGIQLNYKSGYMWDVLGFDVSYFGGFKLDGGRGNTTGDLLHQTNSNDDNLKNRDLHDYNKIGVANVKARFGDDDVNAMIRGGRMLQDNPIMASSSSRLTPSSFEGTSLDADFYGFDVYYSYLTRQSIRNKNSFQSFENGAGKKIDDIQVVGFNYEFDMGLGFEVAYGKAKDYKDRGMGELYYVYDIQPGVALKFDGQYHWVKGDSKKLYDHPYASLSSPESIEKYADGKNYESSLYNLNVELVYHELTAAISYTQVKDAYFDYYMDAHDHGTATFWTSREISDFNHEDEKVWQASLVYDFAQFMPGFKAGMTYTKGTDAYSATTNKKDGKEWERDVVLSYDFQQESLKGLSLSYQYNVWRNNDYEAFGGSRGRDDHKVYLDYKVALF